MVKIDIYYAAADFFLHNSIIHVPIGHTVIP